MSFSNWFENIVMNHIFGKSIHSATTMYIGLCSSNPGEDATGNNCHEMPNSNGYARVGASSSSWSSSSGGIIYNSATITFPNATGNWGTVTHFVLCNSGSWGGGNVLLYGVLDASRYITKYSVPRFDPWELSVSLD